MTSAFTPLLAAALCCMASSPLWAQMQYVCRDASGNSFSTSRPCPSGSTTSVAATGPVSPPPTWRYEPPVRSAPPEGPAYQRYMSARCRSLSDTLRGGSYGIQPDAYAGMRREYQRDCREEEYDASSRYYKEQGEARRQRQEQEQQLRVAAQASQAEATRRAEQCMESRRILTAKRARTDLTEGERKDLKRFEDAYEARCQR
ncbi:hypothetical protein [Paracidovorax valerianellae]|uniref:DUF4124 domain-containing protein n=1 Tax=Paracidovorax valerianellae TaxID=187868 RepID=A0A1G7BDN9_9BURK|nr:hypothetical protein [Paracidovorax valerianellae]MDA8445884.1 hypothetical protein [Paracidovorax valerianellae]SDE25218.1 hypothetical protein SAMN05192589_11439 [Paracidovorax valerianellae]